MANGKPRPSDLPRKRSIGPLPEGKGYDINGLSGKKSKSSRKPCKRGKVRRRVKGGRMMCVPKKRAAPKRKKAAPKRRAAPRKTARRSSAPRFVSSGYSRKPSWLFNWTSGGFNSVEAPDRATAIERALAMEKRVNARGPNFKKLYVDVRTVRMERPGEYASLLRQFD